MSDEKKSEVAAYGAVCRFLEGGAREIDLAATREAELQAEIERLNARVSELVTLLDAQVGTPCEQIRHQQERAAAYAAGLEAAIEYHDDQHDLETMTAEGYGEVGPLVKSCQHALIAAHHFHSAVDLRRMKNCAPYEKPQEAPTAPEPPTMPEPAGSVSGVSCLTPDSLLACQTRT